MNYTFSPETAEKLSIKCNTFIKTVWDLLIPENAKKVWGKEWVKIMEGEVGEWDYPEPKTIHMWEWKSKQFLTLIQQGTLIEDIEEWFEGTMAGHG